MTLPIDFSSARSRGIHLRSISQVIHQPSITESSFKIVYYCKFHWSSRNVALDNLSQIAKFMGPTWGPPESCRPQMGPMLVPWTLLSGYVTKWGPRCMQQLTLNQTLFRIIWNTARFVWFGIFRIFNTVAPHCMGYWEPIMKTFLSPVKRWLSFISWNNLNELCLIVCARHYEFFMLCF